jgi:hypothetical protein
MTIDVNCRMIVQKIINENIVDASGDFHSNEFDDTSFIIDLNKACSLKSKIEDVNSEELLKNIIKTSTVKVRGRINTKELKPSKLIKELFEKLEIQII